MNQHSQPVDDSAIEEILSEKEDQETEPAGFEIVTYPTDFTLEGLVAKYQRGTIKAPNYQRKFVWNINQSSRLIESFLLGLPVPAIFLYTDPKDDNKQLVVDGQQRLLSIVYFFEGFFGIESKGKRIVFNLTGLNVKSPYFGKSYSNLKETDEAAFNKLNDAVLRAFIIKQLNPKSNSSVYHIFERLNTGGTQLVGQEIRNCIFHGGLNDLLNKMNKLTTWRKIFGKEDDDKRQRDVELILRFLALYHSSESYKKPMKDFLSNFMSENRNPSKVKLTSFEKLFNDTTSVIFKNLGERPFHIRAGLNASAFDCVYIAFGRNLRMVPRDVSQRYTRLLQDREFNIYTSAGTTDEQIIEKRLELAGRILFR